MDDDFVATDLVEDEIGIGRRRYAADAWISGWRADVGILQKQIDDSANATLDIARAARGPGSDIAEDLVEIRQRGKRVAQPHRPCLAQTART